MKKILSIDGTRTRTGWHTGFALYASKGKYYVSTEAGSRPCSKAKAEKLIKEYK